MTQSPGTLGILTANTSLTTRIANAAAQATWKVECYIQREDLLADAHKLTAVIVDFRWGDSTALELQRDLKDRGAYLPVVVVVEGHLSPRDSQTMLRNGCLQFLDSEADTVEVIKAVTGLHLTAVVYKHCDQERQSFRKLFQSLSSDECQVARMIVEGHPNKVIASRVDVSLRTVESRRARVFTKTGLESVCQLSKWLAILEGKLISLERFSEKLPTDVKSTVVHLLTSQDEGAMIG